MKAVVVICGSNFVGAGELNRSIGAKPGVVRAKLLGVHGRRGMLPLPASKAPCGDAEAWLLLVVPTNGSGLLPVLATDGEYSDGANDKLGNAGDGTIDEGSAYRSDTAKKGDSQLVSTVDVSECGDATGSPDDNTPPSDPTMLPSIEAE